MTTYMVRYRAKSSAEDMASVTPETAKAGMEAWMAWAEHPHLHMPDGRIHVLEVLPTPGS